MSVVLPQYFVLNITVYEIMCLFTILMLNVCGVTQSFGQLYYSDVMILFDLYIIFELFLKL
jgi:hypothetical protein